MQELAEFGWFRAAIAMVRSSAGPLLHECLRKLQVLGRLLNY